MKSRISTFKLTFLRASGLIAAGVYSFIKKAATKSYSAIDDINMKVKPGFVMKRRGFFSKCLFLCCLRLVNDTTWSLCQLCQWSIQYHTYCSMNKGVILWSADLGFFGSNLSIWVRRRYQFQCGEQMDDNAAWKY